MTYTIAQLFVNYILRSPQRGATIMLAPMLESALDVQLLSIVRHDIDRPLLLSIARYCYRSPATIIDRDATPIEDTTY